MSGAWPIVGEAAKLITCLAVVAVIIGRECWGRR